MFFVFFCITTMKAYSFFSYICTGFNSQQPYSHSKFCKPTSVVSLHYNLYTLFFRICSFEKVICSKLISPIPSPSVRPSYRFVLSIMPTRPCNVNPLIPHYYIEKLGCTGVYIIILFLLKTIDCGYSVEPSH